MKRCSKPKHENDKLNKGNICGVWIRCYAVTQETVTVSWQRLGNNVSAATNTHATIELRLEMGYFYMIRAEML
jgi:hypothetical protein